MTRYVTTGTDVTWISDDTPMAVEIQDPERFRLYRLCDGNLELVATCGTPEAVGVALILLAREGEFDKCPIGILDRPEGQETGTWLIKPWLPFPTPKTLSDAGRALRSARQS